MHSYEYRGYTLVVMPSGKILIHEGTGTVPPDGKLVDETNSLDAAMNFVNEKLC